MTARTLQGAFGAILAPAALGTLITTFRDPRERGRAFGVFGSVAGAGGAVGLILGGFLTQDLSWRDGPRWPGSGRPRLAICGRAGDVRLAWRDLAAPG